MPIPLQFQKMKYSDSGSSLGDIEVYDNHKERMDTLSMLGIVKKNKLTKLLKFPSHWNPESL